MTQKEKRLFLIKYLLNENSKYSNIVIPEDIEEQKKIIAFIIKCSYAPKSK